MPISLDRAPKGQIVRPPKMIWTPFAIMRPDRLYKVVKHDKKYCWLRCESDELSKFMPEDNAPYQLKVNQEMLLPEDEIPLEGRLQIKQAEERKGVISSTSVSGGPLEKKKKRNLSTFHFDPQAAEDMEDLAPQAKVCVNIVNELIAKHKKNQFSREELEKEFNVPANVERLNTSQTPFGIFWYYSKVLEKKGFVSRW